MTVGIYAEKLNLTPLVLADSERDIEGGYCGDLLSWVMGRAKADCVWITIMTNVNTIAVASLADVACIVLAEGCTLEAEAKERARAQGVNVLSSQLAAFELAAATDRLFATEKI